jgi:hypothetical protein
MTVSDTAANPSSSGELDLLRQRITELEAEREEWIIAASLYEEKINKFKETIGALSSENFDLKREVAKLREEGAKTRPINEKNRTFQTRCIQIANNEEPMIEYRPPFLNGLELDAFFQEYRIALEVQGAQHRFHHTSWYKDVKKLEDIVNRDRQKRCICLDNGIFLLEVWYDEKSEIVIPKRIQKIKIKHSKISLSCN